jgi:DNA-binding transcriptional MerR regulator
MNTDKATFRIAEVAKMLGVHANTIRNLETTKVFVAVRDRAGQRRFTHNDIAALRAIFYPQHEERAS